MLLHALRKIVPLEYPGYGVLRAEFDPIVAREFAQPAAVEVHDGLFGVEDLEHLFLVRFRVGGDFFGRHGRARRVLARGVADEPGEIADEKNHRMAQDLKMFELLNKNGVTEVKVGRGRIEPRLDAQRLRGRGRALQARAQLFNANRLFCAFGQVSDLFVESHGISLGRDSPSPSRCWIASAATALREILRLFASRFMRRSVSLSTLIDTRTFLFFIICRLNSFKPLRAQEFSQRARATLRRRVQTGPQ